jgi:cell division protein ZapA (FtsZ GTPase activity inhibitor)
LLKFVFFGNHKIVKGNLLERLVKFKVLGQEIPLYTEAPEEELKEILSLVKTQYEEIKQSSANIPAGKAAILVSLNMATKYIKLKSEHEKYKQHMNKNMGELSNKIDKAF